MLFMWPGTSKGQKDYSHAMRRIPPNQKIRRRIEELLDQGLDGETDHISLSVRLGIG